VKNRFQSLPFKCNLQRYSEVGARAAELTTTGTSVVGLYNFDPELESAWFQPLNLKCDLLVSIFAFSISLLVPLQRGRGDGGGGGGRQRWGRTS
jgi:hypothetical protein